MKFAIFKLIILLFEFKINILFSPRDYLDTISLYRNEICSYNGIPYYNSTTNEVTCECNEKFTNEPRKDKIKYINGHMVQCSYERKSRFFVIFLALCIPIGFDFLYLRRYIYFIIILINFITVFILNIIVFILNYKMNLKSRETAIQSRLKKYINNQEKEKKIKLDHKTINLLNIICKILTYMYFGYIIIDIILHFIGNIHDENKVETENDLGYIFTTPD